jgi:predicted ATPase
MIEPTGGRDQADLFPDLASLDEPPPEQFPTAFLARDAEAPHLERVRIDGLKGFDDCTIHLAPLTLLTGPNNSGKSTVLQAIALGFECFRRCLNTAKWTLQKAGRSVTEFDFLPVNEPKDLWFEKTWKPSLKTERYVRVSLGFSNGFQFSGRLRFLYGGINLGVEVDEGEASEEVLRSLAAASPVLLPATPGPGSHEDYFPLAQIHRFLSMREPSRVIRNVLLRLTLESANGNSDALDFVNYVLDKYFATTLHRMDFEESKDLEVRAPLRSEGADYVLDVVSAGSGLSQVLMLAAVLAWRKPGLVLLDEPDAHLHSSVQAQLLDFLSDLATQFHIQIIAATHSRDLISRAPLQSIVPVDRARVEVRPLQSIEHILLEFQRHGSIDNVDLALLYQTRRCLFVEGKKDIDLLPRLAERLKFPLFHGSSQLVPFDIGGVGKVNLVPELASLFERLVGAPLRWGLVRDSDANVPEIKEALRTQAEALDVPVFHIWSRYSVENYVIEPELLQAALAQAHPKEAIGLDDIRRLLGVAIGQIEQDVDGAFITNTQTAYREVLQASEWYHKGAAAATRYVKSLDTLEKRLAAYPGARIFGKFVQQLQQEFKVSLRLDDVIAVLTRENAPSELLDCFEALATI